MNQQILEVQHDTVNRGLYRKFQNEGKQQLIKRDIAATVLQRLWPILYSEKIEGKGLIYAVQNKMVLRAMLVTVGYAGIRVPRCVG